MEVVPHDSTLYNKDLAPVPTERRTWGIYNYASLWVAMSVCIPTYMLASGLIAGGMNWWQAIATILLGNLIVLIPMLLNELKKQNSEFSDLKKRNADLTGRLAQMEASLQSLARQQ